MKTARKGILNVAIISDTHGYLPESAKRVLETADIIMHAGDIGSFEIFSYLKSKNAYMVKGNADDPTIQDLLPDHRIITMPDKSKIMLIHDAGPFDTYNAITVQLLRKYHISILVAGHTHIAKIQNSFSWGHLYINPGSCGNFGPHKKKTMVVFKFFNKIQDLKLIELEDNVPISSF